MDWSEVAYPTGCLADGYVSRLLTVALFPFAVIIGVPILLAITIVFVGFCTCTPDQEGGRTGVHYYSSVMEMFSADIPRRLSGRRTSGDVGSSLPPKLPSGAQGPGDA